MKIEKMIQPKKVQLISFGCSKNRVDSERILKQIEGASISVFLEYENIAVNHMDFLLINTCGFIKSAKQESIDAIFTAIEAKKRGYVKQIIVFGCLSERYREELKENIPEVDAFFGTFDNDSIFEALSIVKNKNFNHKRRLTTPSHYAYLKISEGCDRVCSFCAIPLSRGKYISTPMEDLLIEAENLVKEGVKELILVAQDTTYYGVDLYGKRVLGELINKLSEIKDLKWIRLHYSHPASFPADVLEIMANNPKVCKYLDIPLQHISDKVLSAMRRFINAKGTKDLLDKIRSSVPEIVLRTTMIVGHPGEDNHEFKKLLKFVGDAKFERLGAFVYSEEDGTYAAKKYKDTVRESTKQSRYVALMEKQATISTEYNLSRVGTEVEVIIDSFFDGILIGRSQYESPEVDGEILIGAEDIQNPELLIGTFVMTKIVEASEYDLIAKLIK